MLKPFNRLLLFICKYFKQSKLETVGVDFGWLGLHNANLLSFISKRSFLKLGLRPSERAFPRPI